MLGATIFITSAYICALLAYRLYFHMLDKEGQGVEAWLRESFARFGLAESSTEHGVQKSSLQMHKSLSDRDNSDLDAEVTVEDNRPAKDVKVEDTNSSDGWAAVDQSLVGEVPEISKAVLNPAHF